MLSRSTAGLAVAAIAVAGLVAGCLGPEEAPEVFVPSPPVWQSGDAWVWQRTDSGERVTLALGPATGQAGDPAFLAVQQPQLGWPVKVATPHNVGWRDAELARGTPFGDICQRWSAWAPVGGSAGGPGVSFPLVEGTFETTELDLGTMRRVLRTDVTGLEEVTVPAGTFQAVRLERRVFYDATDANVTAWLEAQQTDRLSALNRPAQAVVHYAPSARHVVRWEGTLVGPSARVPGQSTYLVPGVPSDPVVVELVAASTGQPAPTPGDLIVDPAWCPAYDTAPTALPPGTGAVDLQVWPSAIDLPGPGKSATFTALTAAGDVRWELATADGSVLATAEGLEATFTPELPGIYTVTALTAGHGGVLRAQAYLAVDERREGVLACEGATTRVPELLGLPEAGGCEPVRLEVGSGTGALRVRLEADGPASGAGCNRLDIAQDEAAGGTASFYHAGLLEPYSVEWTAMPGPVAVSWHPTAGDAGKVRYAVQLDFASPLDAQATSRSGQGSC